MIKLLVTNLQDQYLFHLLISIYKIITTAKLQQSLTAAMNKIDNPQRNTLYEDVGTAVVFPNTGRLMADLKQVRDC